MFETIVGIVIFFFVLMWVNKKIDSYILKNTDMKFIPEKVGRVTLLAATGLIVFVTQTLQWIIKGILFLLTL